ncbi:MAG: SCO family protein [Flavobacteriaceae bacterium]
MSKPFFIKIFSGMAVIVASLAVYFFILKDDELPVYRPSDFHPRLVDVSLQNASGTHQVADFVLINQNGDTITQKDYRDKIYVADFIFTRCPSICPIMTNNMVKLQQVFQHENEVKFLSLSVTPELDSVPVLKAYANKNGVLDSKWNITTGDKKHIYDMARKSYFAVVDEGDGGLQDFIHTPNFILVDQNRRIRGVYDGTSNADLKKLIKDIKRLLN